MESGVQDQRPDGQQVMIAQVRDATLQEPRPLEGETHGPNYDRGPHPPQQLPNGVPHRPLGASPTAESDLAAFAYSPSAERHEMGGGDRDCAPRGPAPAFYQEALPAQPERLGMAGPVEPAGQMRSFGGASAATMNWMTRLGDFLRTQVQGGMETRTTMTRQQVVGSRELGGLVVQQEQLQHTTSQPASPHNRLYPAAPSSPFRDDMGEGEQDPPLFGVGARRVMESWAQRAPLLHGGQRTQQGPGTDAGSTGSIPREVVQEEVRRQVQEALEGQRRSLERLQEENRLLKDEMRSREGIGLHPRTVYQKGIGLHPRTVYQKGIGLHPRTVYLTGIGLHPYMVYQKGIGLHPCVTYQKGVGLHPRMEYLRGISNQLFRVVEYLRGISNQLFRVVEYLRGISNQLFRVVEYLRGIISQLPRVVEYLRGKDEWGIRTSPLGRTRRKPSSSPTRPAEGLGRASFAYGVTGLLDGDGYSFPQSERVYRQPKYQETKTFGDYDVSVPPGLGFSAEGAKEAPRSAPAEPSTAPATGDAANREPNPLEVLITGMTQLQQLLLKKGEGLDVEAKGMPELPKLSEYSPETGAIEFQDYLYLVEQQIGSLASGAGEWWQKTLEVAQAAYTEYQALSPVKRLGVKAQLTAELKEERYRRLEKKVAAMLLSSLPKGVKDDLIAYR
ncbi:GIP, partial [Symbiodinium sp. CCMP2592]